MEEQPEGRAHKSTQRRLPRLGSELSVPPFSPKAGKGNQKRGEIRQNSPKTSPRPRERQRCGVRGMEARGGRASHPINTSPGGRQVPKMLCGQDACPKTPPKSPNLIPNAG